MASLSVVSPEDFYTDESGDLEEQERQRMYDATAATLEPRDVLAMVLDDIAHDDASALLTYIRETCGNPYHDPIRAIMPQPDAWRLGQEMARRIALVMDKLVGMAQAVEGVR